MSPTCVSKANQVLMVTAVEAQRHVERLFKSLTADDFAHVETMRGPPTILGDVYGKIDEHALWFIKIHCEADTLIMSCHEADHDIVLANGARLRRRKE